MAELDDNLPTKKIRQGGSVCSAVNCHNCNANSSVSLFQFPKDKER